MFRTVGRAGVFARVFARVFVTIVMIGIPACGTGNGDPAPFESLSACQGDWQTVAHVDGYGSSLLLQDGMIYFEPASSHAIVDMPLLAQPISGAMATTVGTVPPSIFGSVFYAAEIWLEGDVIIYTQGEKENQFYSVPLAGGAPQLLADVGAGRPDAGNARHHALSATDFVWTEESNATDGPTSVFSVPRSGGTPSRIGGVAEPSGIAGIAMRGDEVLVATQVGTAYAFALHSPTPPRILATRDDVTQGTSRFAGIDQLGAFWSVPRPGAATQASLSALALTPADGGPCEPSPPELPPTPASNACGRTEMAVGSPSGSSSSPRPTAAWSGRSTRRACRGGSPALLRTTSTRQPVSAPRSRPMRSTSSRPDRRSTAFPGEPTSASRLARRPQGPVSSIGADHTSATGACVTERAGILVFVAILGGCASRSGGPPIDGGLDRTDAGGSAVDGAGDAAVDRPAADAAVDRSAVDAAVGRPADGAMVGGTGGSGGSQGRYSLGQLNRKIDILFMVDNSPAMLPLQAKLISQFSTFTDILKTLPTGDGVTTGLPDLHLAVISSDTGPGKYDLPAQHCVYAGDQGRFMADPRGTCAARPLPAGQYFLKASRDQADKNYLGDISTAFTCIAALGDQGCGFEGQIKSVRWALDPLQPPYTNLGFLRDDAYLAVILITNEDDCSLPDDSDLADTSQTRMSDPLGPLSSWRCNEFGHLCDIGGTLTPPPRGPATSNLQGCVSNETVTGKLTHIADEVAFIKGLKQDPNQIFVAAITGPTTPYSLEMIQLATDIEPHPSIVHSCTLNTGEYADPAVRIQQYVNGFGNHGLTQTICANSFVPALTAIATELTALLTPPCITATLVDTDPATPGLQPDCLVTDTYVDGQNNPVSTPLPACATAGGATPCWSLVANPSKCPAPPSLMPAINRGAAQLPNDLRTYMSCASCSPGTSKPGCP